MSDGKVAVGPLDPDQAHDLWLERVRNADGRLHVLLAYHDFLSDHGLLSPLGFDDEAALRRALSALERLAATDAARVRLPVAPAGQGRRGG